MHPTRKRRLLLILALVAVAGVATALPPSTSWGL